MESERLIVRENSLFTKKILSKEREPLNFSPPRDLFHSNSLSAVSSIPSFLFVSYKHTLSIQDE